MEKIDKHIGALLYDHECVIVPDLGGFLSSYMSSNVQPSRHMVSPPAKKIAFNVYLKQNDGLLANQLVQTESISYPEALREIETYVSHCYSELNAGKKFVIERVGVLSRNAEANVQFEAFSQVNYLKSSFGFAPVQLIPVVNSEFDQEVEKQLRDFISLRPSQAQARAGVMRKKVRLNSLNTLLLSGSILWLCLNLYIVSPTKMNMASLNPFSARTETVVPEKTTAPVYTQPSVAKPETVYVKSTEPILENEITPSQKLDQAVHANAQPDSFFIVAGAFSSASNADKKASELKSQGFAQASVIEYKGGLKLVTYDGFSTREGAMDELNRLKALKKEGWIYQR